jgi:hypothetical protein
MKSVLCGLPHRISFQSEPAICATNHHLCNFFYASSSVGLIRVKGWQTYPVTVKCMFELIEGYGLLASLYGV